MNKKKETALIYHFKWLLTIKCIKVGLFWESFFQKQINTYIQTYIHLKHDPKFVSSLMFVLQSVKEKNGSPLMDLFSHHSLYEWVLINYFVCQGWAYKNAGTHILKSVFNFLSCERKKNPQKHKKKIHQVCGKCDLYSQQLTTAINSPNPGIACGSRCPQKSAHKY